MTFTTSSVCLIALLLALVNVQAFAKERWENNPLVVSRPSDEIERMRALRRDVLDIGCEINLCFALDGSSAVSASEFLDQKHFVDLIAAITTTDDPGNYCAVQIHNYFTPIAPLTQNLIPFLNAVQGTKQIGGISNIVPSIQYALKQLHRQDDDANMIIFFSKGKPTISRLPPAVGRFLRRGGAICSVAHDEGYYNDLAKVTGDLGRVVPLDGFFDLSEIVVAVVADVCSLPCSTRPAARRRFRNSRGQCPPRVGDPDYEPPSKKRRPEQA